jgi:hypothetical protein
LIIFNACRVEDHQEAQDAVSLEAIPVSAFKLSRS